MQQLLGCAEHPAYLGPRKSRGAGSPYRIWAVWFAPLELLLELLEAAAQDLLQFGVVLPPRLVILFHQHPSLAAVNI